VKGKTPFYYYFFIVPQWLIWFLIGYIFAIYLNIETVHITFLGLIFFLLGFVFSLYLGNIVIQYILNKFKDKIGKMATEQKVEIPGIYEHELFIPGSILGIYERILFTPLIAFEVSGIGGGMFIYITVKMTIDWLNLLKRGNESDFQNTGVRSLVFRSLIGNILSMAFALIGGLICQIGINLMNS